MEAIELVEDEGAGCRLRRVVGREHDLPDREGCVGVGEDGAIWTDLDGSGLLIDVDGDAVAFDVRLEGEGGKGS